MAEDNFGTSDAENPEWTEADLARARRWRPGDPVGTEPVAQLRDVASDLRRQAGDLRRQADTLDEEAETLDRTAEQIKRIAS